ncbi:hypothetical protein [Mycoplasma sp. OR1901]|uniref:hypothetical protein n=1 Tax=Mycoplasma sp. OR1901 TaxID=2742195 RepID=UPI0015836EBA|nr:hypothetical protein [Mycoplasma sp. OR1901]QKT05399.1 hypothetical protein HTZ87_01640 [Mycoplasma sp. OR1901]
MRKIKPLIIGSTLSFIPLTSVISCSNNNEQDNKQNQLNISSEPKGLESQHSNQININKNDQNESRNNSSQEEKDNLILDKLDKNNDIIKQDIPDNNVLKNNENLDDSKQKSDVTQSENTTPNNTNDNNINNSQNETNNLDENNNDEGQKENLNKENKEPNESINSNSDNTQNYELDALEENYINEFEDLKESKNILQTLEQRLNKIIKSNKSIKDIDRNLSSKTYAINTSEFLFRDKNGNSKTFKNFVNKDKISVVTFGFVNDQKYIDLAQKLQKHQEWNIINFSVLNGTNTDQFEVYFPDNYYWNRLTRHTSVTPVIFILDKENNVTFSINKPNYEKIIALTNYVGDDISTIYEAKTQSDTIIDRNANKDDKYNGEYELIKKVYPNDSDNINNIFELDDLKREKQFIEQRTSQLGDKDAEINELKDLFTKFIDNFDFNTLSLVNFNFDSRNMAKALLKWAKEDWIDHAYAHFGGFPASVSTENKFFNEQTQRIDDEFIKLLSITKSKSQIDMDILNDNDIKSRLLNFVKDGLALIDENMDEQEKIFVIAHYVAQKLSFYDDAVYYQLSETMRRDFLAVCQQYAWLGSLMLNILGIQSFPKISNNNAHQFIWVKTKTKQDSEPKWYYLDTLFIDSESMTSDQLPSGTLNVKFWHGYLLKIKLDSAYYENSWNKLSYAGYKIWHQLPLDDLFYNNEISQQDYGDKTILWDTEIKQTSNEKIHKQSNYFWFKNKWYFFGAYLTNDGSQYLEDTKIGLFSAEFHNKDSIKLLSKDHNNLDENERLLLQKIPSNIFEPDQLESTPKVFVNGQKAFVYKYLRSKNEHKLYMINLNDGEVKDLTETFNQTITDKNQEYDIYSYENKLFIIKNRTKKHQAILGWNKFVIEIENSTKTPINKFDLYKSALLKRLEVGTYIYQENYQENKNYRPLEFRTKFDQLWKSFDSKYKNSNIEDLNLILSQMDEIIEKVKNYQNT